MATGVEVPELPPGARRVLALACRALGYRNGVVVLREPDGRLRGLGSVGDDDDSLLAAAQTVLDSDSPFGDAGPETTLTAPLRDGAGSVVGALCLSDGPDERLRRGGAPTLADFAEILEDHLELSGLPSAVEAGRGTAWLAAGLEAGEVRAWFQPIVRLDDESIVGFEALARWFGSDGEVAVPAEFVPLAERSDLVVELDMAVLRSAVAELARWQVTHPDLRMSVNISGRHLDRSGWVEEVHQAVTAAGVAPRAVELELTESMRPADIARCRRELQWARERGYEVWLDDFGTGWSQLRQLVDLPIDGLKIDRFFTESLGGRGESVVRAMLQVAHEMGLATVIEGVATTSHAARARELECQLGQGFLWSPALPPDEVDLLLARPGPLRWTAAGG